MSNELSIDCNTCFDIVQIKETLLSSTDSFQNQQENEKGEASERLVDAGSVRCNGNG